MEIVLTKVTEELTVLFSTKNRSVAARGGEWVGKIGEGGRTQKLMKKL